MTNSKTALVFGTRGVFSAATVPVEPSVNAAVEVLNVAFVATGEALAITFNVVYAGVASLITTLVTSALPSFVAVILYFTHSPGLAETVF